MGTNLFPPCSVKAVLSRPSFLPRLFGLWLFASPSAREELLPCRPLPVRGLLLSRHPSDREDGPVPHQGRSGDPQAPVCQPRRARSGHCTQHVQSAGPLLLLAPSLFSPEEGCYRLLAFPFPSWVLHGLAAHGCRARSSEDGFLLAHLCRGHAEQAARGVKPEQLNTGADSCCPG